MSKKRNSRTALKFARSRGFTLIEVLVALAIAALGLASLMAAAGTGLGITGLADRYIEATRRAQSHLALIGSATHLEPGEHSGDDGGGFSWRVRISPPLVRAATKAGSPAPPAVFTVDVTISWPAGAGIKSVSLESQRLGYPSGGNG